MISKFLLTVEWEKCEGDGFLMDNADIISSWIEGTIDSNAHFEHLDLDVVSMKEVTDGV